jgi:hypothetical protein
VVVGLDVWRDHFKDFTDRYALVGGVACDTLMTDAGLPFRATKDLDVVLLVEVLDAAFAEAFWAFVEAGGYERKEKSEGGNLYRFAKPATRGFPYMIELFSRAPDGFTLGEGSHLTPLPIDETVASLSAILLDETYYGLLQANLREVEGLPLLSEAAVIPFKARAYLDLVKRSADGEKVDSKDIKKHRNDVFRLLQLLPAQDALALPDPIRADMQAFVAAVKADDGFRPADFDVHVKPDVAVGRLVGAYGLDS